MTSSEMRPLDQRLERIVESARLAERLIALAAEGGDVGALLESALGEVPLQAPRESTLRDELRRAREAASMGNSANSVGDLAALAEGASNVGLPEVAAVICAEARNLAASLGAAVDPSDVGNLENVTGLLALHVELPDQAERAFTAAVAHARNAGDEGLAGAALLNLCNVRLFQGRTEDAREYARESLAAYSRLQDSEGQAKLLLTLASVALGAGDREECDATLSDAAGVVKRARKPGLTASLHLLRGLSLARDGAPEASQAEFKSALAAARRAGDIYKQVSALQSLAAAAHDMNRPALARRRLIAATELAASHHMSAHLRTLLPSLARAEHRAGNRAAALRYARQSLELAQISGLGLPDAQALLGAALLDAGSLEEGIELLRDALPALVEELRDDEAAVDELRSGVHNLVLAHRRLGTIWEAQTEIRGYVDILPPGHRADLLQLMALSLDSVGANTTDVGQLLLESIHLRPQRERAWAGLVAAAQLMDSPGRSDAAVSVLDRVLEDAAAEQQDELVLQIRNDLALALAASGAFERAIDLLEINAEEARSRSDRVSMQLAAHNLSETYRRVGRADDAESAARESLQLGEQLEDAQATAEAQLQLGLVLSDKEDLDGARAAFRAAEEGAAEDAATRASALAGLAGLAIAEERLDEAVELYRSALQLHRDADPIKKLERLLGLCEALAGLGNRRSFNRRLQQIVDLNSLQPLGDRVVFGLARSSRRWADAGRLDTAGEVLAVVVLLGAVSWSLSDQPRDEVDAHSPLVLGLSVAAHELVREESEGLDAQSTRRALEEELARHLEPAGVNTMRSWLEDALDAAESAAKTDMG